MATNGSDNPGTRKPSMVSDEEASKIIKENAAGFRTVMRAPILAYPSDYGLDYEDVFFPSQDGIPLEAWLIPCANSSRLIIANHPRNFNRYGCPTHLEPFSTFGGWAHKGNTTEVNYVTDYKILHNAGYNVLAYDMRNFGLSGAAHGGLSLGGIYESRDVVGSLEYVRKHPRLNKMSIGLLSRCNGANATLYAMHTQPKHFRDVRCLVAPQALSTRAVSQRHLEALGVYDKMDELDKAFKEIVGISLDDMSPIPWAKSTMIPTFLYQVKDDQMTYDSDMQAIYDSIPIEEKYLHWITDTTARWDGYREFSKRPEPMLAWFDKYMSGDAGAK